MKKTTIVVDGDLAELMPIYLQSRRDELERLPELLKQGDFTQLQGIGHKLRGSGGGFGLDFLTELGKRMEAAGSAADKQALAAQVAELKAFLESLQIEFSHVGQS